MARTRLSCRALGHFQLGGVNQKCCVTLAEEYQFVCFLVVNRMQKKAREPAGRDDEFWLRDVAAHRLTTVEPLS